MPKMENKIRYQWNNTGRLSNLDKGIIEPFETPFLYNVLSDIPEKSAFESKASLISIR
jgi:hypothetical protein